MCICCCIYYQSVAFFDVHLLLDMLSVGNFLHVHLLLDMLSVNSVF